MTTGLRGSLMTLALAVSTGLPAGASAQWYVPGDDMGLGGSEVRAVDVAEDGTVWLGVRDRGLARLRGGELEWVSDDALPDGIAEVYEDRAGRLWIAGVGGIAVLERGGWTAHHRLGRITPRVVFGIHEDARSGTIWAAASGGTGALTSDGWRTIGVEDGLPHSVVHAVVVDSAGAVWLSCRRGLARVHHGGVTVFHPEVNFRSAAVDETGTPWFGTSDGIFSWENGSLRRHREGRPTFPIVADARGSIWAGAPGAGLVRLRDDRWADIPLPGPLQGAEVFDLAAAPDGSIWVATAAGVARFDGEVER